MRKPLLIMFLVSLVISVLPLGAGAAETGGFKDTGNHWAKTRIDGAVARGYVSGYPDGTFRPDHTVTRAEFIRMLVDALHLPHSQGGDPWFQPYVAAALEMGLLKDGEFEDLAQRITRLEIMRLLSRGLATDDGYKSYLQTFSGLYNGDIPYIDYRDVEGEDVRHVAMVIGTGIVSGFPDFSLGFHKTATRAEAVVMIENFQNTIVKSPDSFRGLNELKEVAETGTNATTVDKNIRPYRNFKKEPIEVETYKYTAKLKRAYVLPIEGEQSIFDRKLRWDRKNQNDEYINQQKALVLVSFEIKTKTSFALNGLNYATYIQPMGLVRNSDGTVFRTAQEKFGYLSNSLAELTMLEANKTYEIFSTSEINNSFELSVYDFSYVASYSDAWSEYYQIPVFENGYKKRDWGASVNETSDE